MARGHFVFQEFESGKYAHFIDLKYMTDYICGNLNSGFSTNYKYLYNMYSYSSKAYIVCRWRRSKGFEPVAKWGEAICNDNLVHFFKEHKGCSCGSVYFK